MMHCFDRRQIVFGGALIGSTAVLPGNVGALFDLHFRKGTAVPGWMERTTHAGFFGANVAYMHGPCKLMQRRFPEEHVFKLLESAYPHVKNLKASYLRPLVGGLSRCPRFVHI